MPAAIYQHPRTFKLESGKRIKGFRIAYHTYGTLNASKSNVVWVCHALTANSDVMDWWAGLFGEGKLFDPGEHFIVCANVIGSHYGTTGPLSTNVLTGRPFYLAFPQFTVRDMVTAHRLLASHLGIDRIKLLIGGSLGGQQALEWAIIDSERIEKMVLLATNAFHSPWGVAFNESQRLAISTDRTFYADKPNGGAKGLKAARSIALLSYRGYGTYGTTQAERSNDKQDDFRASSYQNYQGEKLAKRFNAYSYWYLSKAMDSHNVGRGRTSVQDALGRIAATTLLVGISSDLLFPVEEQQFMARHIANATYAEINSGYGHDGFLVETDKLAQVIGRFLDGKRQAPASAGYALAMPDSRLFASQ